MDICIVLALNIYHLSLLGACGFNIAVIPVQRINSSCVAEKFGENFRETYNLSVENKTEQNKRELRDANVAATASRGGGSQQVQNGAIHLISQT